MVYYFHEMEPLKISTKTRKMANVYYLMLHIINNSVLAVMTMKRKLYTFGQEQTG